MQVQALIKDKYYDVNLKHLSDLLVRNEGIQVKRENLRGWAHNIHHVKRAKRRRSKAKKCRERMESPGFLLQMDGSPHRWFGNEKSCLIALIDDENNELHAKLFPSETTAGCLKVLRDYIHQKGVFKALYVDRAGIFCGPKRYHFSQVQRACEELGIEIIFANSPKGKGRVERAFDTLQDRLIPELRLQGIHDMASANHYLQEVFIPGYWQKALVVEAKNLHSEFKPVAKDIDLEEIFVQKEYRKIRNDHTFSYSNKFYLIEPDLKHSIAKQKMEIRKQCDGSFTAYFSGRLLAISKVVECVRPTLYDQEIQRKLDAIALAEELGNVTEAARISGCIRETIYKNRRLLKEKGPLALKRNFKKGKHHKNRASKSVEGTVIAFSLANPYLGQARVSAELRASGEADISSSGVRYIWLRENMNKQSLRLEKAAAPSDAA